MNVQNLYFFDKFGRNLNLELDGATNVWKGKIFFEGVSTYLFDNENLFILEKTGPNTYLFPVLSSGQSLDFVWSSNKNEQEFFLYDVVRDIELREQFISKLASKTIAYSDFVPAPGPPLNLRVPLQINIAFNPSDEIKFERTLEIYYNTPAAPVKRTKVAEIYFYGEGIEEDERFRVWAENFGIKFLKEDANILKDYDIKEAYPDYELLNRARKELLVSKEHVYPYIGTYKGLSNFVNLMGYKDVLQIKEYWKNVNANSPYYNRFFLVDISDYLDDGIIDTLNLTDRNQNLKTGRQFKKTEFLAIVYQFTKATNTYDDDGIPLVEETTEFSVNEIFYKLNLLSNKLKEEFLPVNVKIKDVIGEFIYFQKVTISYWPDDTKIFDYDLNDPATIDVYPGLDTNLTLRAIDPLYRQVDVNGIDFGVARINDEAKNPFESGQLYARSDIEKILPTIRTFYEEIKNQRIPDLGKRLTWEFGDDPQRIIAAPVILTLNTGKFTVYDLRGVRLDELDAIAAGLDPYWTLANIDYRNFYEVKWRITKSSPNPYRWEQRGKIVDLYEIPHYLPYAGTYRVTVELYDFYGNVSVFSRFVTVQSDMKPAIAAFTRLEDKFDYQISNLANVQLQDFGASPIYYAKVNVLDNEDADVKINLYKNLTEWISFYKNRYGMGQNIYDVEIYNKNSNVFLPYTDPNWAHEKKSYWGLGENEHPIKIRDFRDVRVGDIFWMRLTDLVYLDDFNAGFYINSPRPGDTIKLSLYSDYVIPPFATLPDLVNILNSSLHPGIRLFNYEIINGRIHAQAEYLSRIMYHILYLPRGGSPSPSPSPAFPGGRIAGDKYTFFLPRKVFSKRTIDFLKSLSPVFDDETMFLVAKTSDVLSGAVQDPNFWQDNNYWRFVNDEQFGFLPTTIDQNAFNINDIKMYQESFTVPENAILFFVINNLDGKQEFIWSLKDSATNEEIFRAKSVPFFVWKFKDQGVYELGVEAVDNRDTSYFSTVPNFVRVVDKNTYAREVETRLNRRKNQLLNSRV